MFSASDLQISPTGSTSPAQNLDYLPIEIVLHSSFRRIVPDHPNHFAEKKDDAAKSIKPKTKLSQGLANERASVPGKVELDAQEPRSTGHQCKDNLGRYCTLSENYSVRLEG